MAERDIENLPPHDRRRFFAAGLGRIVNSISDLFEKKLPFALPVLRPILRPPGALPEKQFLDTCYRCGACADACPAHAISLRNGLDDQQRNTPYVDASVSACVICDELACMKVCPSGALRLVGRLEIRMGLAKWSEDACLRKQGENCTICVDRCPLGATAIRVEEGRIAVIEPDDTGTLGEGCVGCGVCQMYCPTAPKAIVVEPI